MELLQLISELSNYKLRRNILKSELDKQYLREEDAKIVAHEVTLLKNDIEGIRELIQECLGHATVLN